MSCGGVMLAAEQAEADRAAAAAAAALAREKENKIYRGLRGLTSLNPLILFLRTSIPFIWRILSAFPPA
jgi:hypothetical protein